MFQKLIKLCSNSVKYKPIFYNIFQKTALFKLPRNISIQHIHLYEWNNILDMEDEDLECLLICGHFPQQSQVVSCSNHKLDYHMLDSIRTEHTPMGALQISHHLDQIYEEQIILFPKKKRKLIKKYNIKVYKKIIEYSLKINKMKIQLQYCCFVRLKFNNWRIF